MYSLLIRPLLFLLPPEKAHHFVAFMLRFLFNIPGIAWLVKISHTVSHPKLKRELFGIAFPNPVGLAAGFDKDATMFNELSCLGFGFIEIGTVTPKAQPGNDKPRMFRLKKDQALINRMGFNNNGVKAAAEKLKKERTCIIGGNIGKNKITPNENALDDYLICYQELKNVVDYFVVNVSSPNTPGLRALQEKEPLMKILQALQTENSKAQNPKPILLKIAPDLNNDQLNDIVEIVNGSGIAGIIATNTTLSREGLKESKESVEAIGAGGLSGKPLTKRSLEVVAYLHKISNGKIPIIGVGGIHSADDAINLLNAGASLVQLYTGFIYEGPGLIKAINKKLLQ